MKIFLRVLVGLFLLPGFLFDICVGIAFVMNDGRTDHHAGDPLGEYVFGLANSLPLILKPFFMISVAISAIPAGLAVVGGGLGIIIGICYVLLCTGKAILTFPFTGKWNWTLDDTP